MPDNVRIETEAPPIQQRNPNQMKASPASGVPHNPNPPIPKEKAEMEFKAEPEFMNPTTYEPEQLPVVEKTPVKKAPVVPKEEKKEEEVPVEQEEKKEPEEKQEKKAGGIEKFLKPPGGEKKEVVGEKKEEIKPIVPAAGKITRDYTGHTAEEVAAFKQMSDQGYTMAKKLILENKELSKLKDTTYMQHPNAYVLDPGFQSIRSDVTQATKEARYWKEQLLLVAAGKPWKEATGYDKNGNLIIDPTERPANAEAEEELRSLMNQAMGVAQQGQSKLNEYPTKYKQQVTQDMQAIEAECKQRFSWENDPKLLDYSLHVDGIGDRTIKEIINDVKEMFPAYMRGHPAVRVTANLMVALRIGHAELAEARNGKAVEEIKEEEEALGEPKSQAKPPAPKGKPVHGITEFKMDPSLM